MAGINKLIRQNKAAKRGDSGIRPDKPGALNVISRGEKAGLAGVARNNTAFDQLAQTLGG